MVCSAEPETLCSAITSAFALHQIKFIDKLKTKTLRIRLKTTYYSKKKEKIGYVP
jgi:hypothetical protein